MIDRPSDNELSRRGFLRLLDTGRYAPEHLGTGAGGVQVQRLRESGDRVGACLLHCVNHRHSDGVAVLPGQVKTMAGAAKGEPD